MNLLLRKANKEEIPFLQTFSKEVIHNNYRDFLGDEAVDFFIGSGASDQYMEENIDDTVVAVRENEIVAIGVCKEQLIDLVMVRNDLHHQGIGSEFLNTISAELLEKYDRICLESFGKNEKANKFYVKNGWIQDKVVFEEEVGDNRIYYYKMK